MYRKNVFIQFVWTAVLRVSTRCYSCFTIAKSLLSMQYQKLLIKLDILNAMHTYVLNIFFKSAEVTAFNKFCFEGNVHVIWRNPDPSSTWETITKDFGEIDKRNIYMGKHFSPFAFNSATNKYTSVFLK